MTARLRFDDLRLSVVIPVYNDEEVLPELHRRLSDVLSDLCGSYEVVFVNDGSSDSSLQVLKELCDRDPNVKVLDLTRNFGQAGAVAAGLHQTDGDVVCIMDSDLQDPPEYIQSLLVAMFQADASMGIARWITRNDSLRKRLYSKLYQWTVNKFTSVSHTPGTGMFRVIERSALDQLLNFTDRTAPIVTLLHWAGFPYVTVDLHRDARHAGESGYTLRGMIRVALDRLFSYSLVPIRLATLLGLGLGLFSALLAVYFVLNRLLSDQVQPGWTSIIVLLLMLFAVNFLFLGVIGEYIGRLFLEAKGRPRFVVNRLFERRQSHAPDADGTEADAADAAARDGQTRDGQSVET